VIGDAPQDLKYKDEPTGLRIGDNNVFREHVTVHRSAKLFEETVVGSNNFLMAACHVGHNSVIGNHVIIANGALLAGHVTVDDQVFISATCMLHQFVRVGTMALMQGGTGISKDLPPYTISTGNNHICGLNIIGLRRAGVGPEERLELKQVYRAVFRSGQTIRAAADHAFGEFSGERARVMLEFIKASKRGVCSDRSAGSANQDEED
jgi:UDP-N-acetylglucosamine acyltransferase